MRSLSEGFGYDNLDRLTSYENLAGAISYDYNGNILTKMDASSDQFGYHYNSKKVHAVEKIYGSTISDVEQDIDYNAYNKTNSITEGSNSVLFTYGPDEMRRSMQEYTDGDLVKTTYYQPGYEEEVLDGTVTKQINYISGINGLTAVEINDNGNENLYYICKDHLGSITALLNTDGTVAEEYSYDALGRRRNPADWTYNNIATPTLLNRGYTGHEHLDQFGLINMNGRMYDPLVGRMLSPDNFVQDAMGTQNYNKYSYCINNPLKYKDPSGNLYYGCAPFPKPDPCAADYYAYLGDDATGMSTDGSHGGCSDGESGDGGMTDFDNAMNFLVNSIKAANDDAKTPWIKTAKGEIGVTQSTDPNNPNQTIIGYLNTCTGYTDATSDKIPWCSAFVNWVMGQNGVSGTDNASASSWETWAVGVQTENNQYEYGAIVVEFFNGVCQHVGFAVDKTDQYVTILGGNQGNSPTSVNEANFYYSAGYTFNFYIPSGW
jgi:uncharacterized protein (TIGR02594 family)